MRTVSSARPPWPGGLRSTQQRGRWGSHRGPGGTERQLTMLSSASVWLHQASPDAQKKQQGAQGAPLPMGQHREGQIPLGSAGSALGGDGGVSAQSTLQPHPPSCPSRTSPWLVLALWTGWLCSENRAGGTRLGGRGSHTSSKPHHIQDVSQAGASVHLLVWWSRVGPNLLHPLGAASQHRPEFGWPHRCAQSFDEQRALLNPFLGSAKG